MDRSARWKLDKVSERGDVDSVVISQLRRLGRAAKGQPDSIDRLPKRGDRLLSMREGLKLSTADERRIANRLSSAT